MLFLLSPAAAGPPVVDEVASAAAAAAAVSACREAMRLATDPRVMLPSASPTSDAQSRWDHLNNFLSD